MRTTILAACGLLALTLGACTTSREAANEPPPGSDQLQQLVDAADKSTEQVRFCIEAPTADVYSALRENVTDHIGLHRAKRCGETVHADSALKVQISRKGDLVTTAVIVMDRKHKIEIGRPILISSKAVKGEKLMHTVCEQVVKNASLLKDRVGMETNGI
jgi:hypothetical protein